MFAENACLGGSIVGHFICRQGSVDSVGLVGIEEVGEWKVFSAGFFTLNNCLPSSMQSQSSCFANGCPFASKTVLPSEGRSYKRI